jgi:hypothetical protein
MSSRVFAGASAAIAWFGVLLQCWLSVARSVENGRTVADGLILFFGYFTVTTNLLVCFALTLPLLARRSAAGRFFATESVVAGIAANIAFVALAYHFLLRHAWNPQGAQLLADVLLHYAVPGLFLVQWFVYSRRGTLTWVQPLYWSLYPTIYFVYVLVRGEIIGTYPYGFIDARAIGYQRTMVNAVALLLVVFLLGLVVVGVDRSARSRGAA